MVWRGSSRDRTPAIAGEHDRHGRRHGDARAGEGERLDFLQFARLRIVREGHHGEIEFVDRVAEGFARVQREWSRRVMVSSVLSADLRVHGPPAAGRIHRGGDADRGQSQAARLGHDH